MPKLKQQPTMKDLLKGSDLPFTLLRRGDVVEGEVLSVTPQEAIVDVGSKAEGILPQNELKSRKVKVGENVLVYVVTAEDRRGQTILSLDKAESAKAWLDLQRALETNETLEVTITGHNKGGLTVDFAGVAAFVPFSQLSNVPDSNLPRAEVQSLLDKRRGEKIKVKLIELSEDQNRVIFSEVQALEEEMEQERKEALMELSEGEVVEAPIKSVLPYGLALEVDGAEGLIEKEELGWDADKISLADFQVGQKVAAKIIRVDPATGQLRLSIKQVSSDPWEQAGEEMKKGKKFTAEVSKITSFGLFVKLRPGIEGLLPLSALPQQKKDIRVGDKVSVKVSKLDKSNKRVEVEWGGGG